MSLLSRAANVFRPGRVHAELDEELEFHIGERTRELIDSGMASAPAHAAARRQLGNRLRIRESSFDAKAMARLDSVWRDIRFSARMLRKDRTATLAAVLSLALAYAGSGRLGPDGQPEEQERFSYAMLQRFRQAAGADIDLFGVTLSPGFQAATFGGLQSGERNVRAESLSGNGFDALGLRPALGRLFTAEDDRAPGGRSVAVLSHAFWLRQFGGAPSAVGQWITLADKPYRIVGVAQDGFTGLQPGYLTDLWTPLVTAANPRWMADPDAGWVRVWGRMRRGRQAAIAREELQAAFASFRKERGGAAYRPTPLRIHSAATGQASLFRRQFKRPLWILGLISALILAISWSNVANLLIARGMARGREMALRIAIGAGRGRLVQQLLIESVLLAGMASALGLAFAANTAPLVVAQLGPSDFPAYLEVGVGWRVFAFAALCAVVTAAAFGLIPALRASAVSPGLALNAGSGRQSARTGTLRAMLSVQVAFSIAVLFLSGLLVSSFRKLMHADLGFAKERVTLFDLGGKGPSSPAGQLLDRVRQLPGVEAASLSGMALMGGALGPQLAPSIRFPGRDWEAQRPLYLEVSPGFFRTMQIRLLSGREFDAADASAAIVNQAFARKYFPGDDALGRRFERRSDDPLPIALTIIGVVANAHYNNLRQTLTPTVYAPLTAVGGRSRATLEVRTAGDPRGLAGALRREIEEAGPSLKVIGATLQSTKIDDTLISERLLAVLGGLFAAIALVLVTVGLYGVIRYAAARRRKEVGIRIALGARRQAVLRLVWSEVAVPSLVGLVVGIAGGAVAARFLETALYEVKPTDVSSLAAPMLCIVLTSVVASVQPALRLAAADPMTVLRHE